MCQTWNFRGVHVLLVNLTSCIRTRCALLFSFCVRCSGQAMDYSAELPIDALLVHEQRWAKEIRVNCHSYITCVMCVATFAGWLDHQLDVRSRRSLGALYTFPNEPASTALLHPGSMSRFALHMMRHDSCSSSCFIYILLFRSEKKFHNCLFHNLLARDRTRAVEHDMEAEWKLGAGGPAGGGSSRRSDEWAGERESAALSLSENICARRKQWRRERREMHALALPLPTAHKMACRRPRDRARAPALRLRSCARACCRGLARAFCRSAALTPAPPSTSGRACSLDVMC